jgi:MFS family permease
MATSRPSDPPYAWVVVAALSVTEIISWGILYYAFPVVLQSVERDLGASRAAVTGAFSVALGVSALAAVPVGRWIDRSGPRALMTAGSCLAAGLLLAWSRVESLGALYVVWAGMGLAMAAVLYEPAFVAIVQWFPHRRDRALLVVTLAGGLASTIFLPVTAGLLERFGWRTTIQILAAFLAVTTIPIHALVLRSVHSAPRSKNDLPPPLAEGAPLSLAIRTGIFWILAFAFFVSTFTAGTVSVHGIPYLTLRGYSAPYAAIALGWMGAMQLLGRLAFVPIASRLGVKVATATIFFAQGAGMVLLAIVTRLPSLIPVIVLLGAANGMATLARATMVADVFGRRYYGSVNGAIGLWANGGRAVSPVGASLLGVWLGGYEPVFWVLAGAGAVAGVAVLAAEFRRHGPSEPRAS